MEFSVELGSEAAGKMVSEITWSKDSLVVGLHRGAKELVPCGSTQGMPGEYVVILSSGEEEEDVQ